MNAMQPRAGWSAAYSGTFERPALTTVVRRGVEIHRAPDGRFLILDVASRFLTPNAWRGVPTEDDAYADAEAVLAAREVART